MDVLNISIDDNEGDTSQEEFPDDEDLREELGSTSSSKRIKLETENEFSLYNFGDDVRAKLQRPPVLMDEYFEEALVLQEQNRAFKFFMTDCVSTLTSIKHPKISLKKEVTNCDKSLVIRLFGVTQQGNSVCCNVHGFAGYFYALPTNVFTYADVQDFKDILNDIVKKQILQDISFVDFHETINKTPPVIEVELLKLSDVDNVFHLYTNNTLRNSMKSTGSDRVLLKIKCSLPKFVWAAAKVLKNGFVSYPYTNGPCEYDLFEDSINNNIRFLTDKNIPGCGWLELKSQKYFVRSENINKDLPKESHCQIEVDIHCDDLAAVSNESRELQEIVPPLRVLSFDIEVMSQNDEMPAHGKQPIIQIGCTISLQNKEDPLGKVIFTLNDCDPIEGAEVFQFVPKNIIDTDDANKLESFTHQLREQEALMLKAWRDLVILCDPDIITGYNINHFDLPYLIDRANILQPIAAKHSRYLGRIKNTSCVIREIKNPLKCAGNLNFDSHFVNVQGRINFDMFRLLFRHDLTRKGLSLANVAKRHLQNELKGDVPHAQIGALQMGTSADRKKLAIYCLQDAYLAYKLLNIAVPNRPKHGDFIEYYFTKSIATGTLLRYLVNKSENYNQYFRQIRVQKNPHALIFQPGTPSPKKPLFCRSACTTNGGFPRKNLYPELTDECNFDSKQEDQK